MGHKLVFTFVKHAHDEPADSITVEFADINRQYTNTNGEDISRIRAIVEAYNINLDMVDTMTLNGKLLPPLVQY